MVPKNDEITAGVEGSDPLDRLFETLPRIVRNNGLHDFPYRRNLSSRGEDFWVASLVVMHAEMFEASPFNASGVSLVAPSLISFGPRMAKGLRY